MSITRTGSFWYGVLLLFSYLTQLLVLGTFVFLFFPSDFNTSLVLVLGPMLIFGLVLKAGMKSGIMYSYCTYIPGIIISGSYQTDTGIKVCSHLGLGTLVLKFPNVAVVI
jgi:hypothetical protein